MPAELVNRLARMFQDIKVSHDLTRDFHDRACNNNAPGDSNNNAAAAAGGSSGIYDYLPAVAINIKILSSGTWLPRTLPKVALVLPPELEDFIPQVSFCISCDLIVSICQND